MTFNDPSEQQEYLQTRIDEVMDWFDFERVHTAMTALDWSWSSTGGVPSIPELREHVRKAMKYTFNEVVYGRNTSFYITGGFNIQCIRDEDKTIYFKVVFELSDWTTDVS